MTWPALSIATMLACEGDPVGPPRSPKPTVVIPTDSYVVDPTAARDIWTELGACEHVAEALPLPPPQPPDCRPAPPGWTSGPAASRAQARIFGVGNDTLGYTLAVVDPEQDGTDALLVGVPRVSGDPMTGYGHVLLIEDLVGEILPTASQIIASEVLTGQFSIGQAIGVLDPWGPAMVGDNHTFGKAPVLLIDVPGPDPDVLKIGAADELCGTMVTGADLDGNGERDPTVACGGLGGTNFLGFAGAFRPNPIPGQRPLEPFFRIDGTVDAIGFGASFVSGLDLDRDGFEDFVFSEAVTGAFLGSVNHVLFGPRTGWCNAKDDAVTIDGSSEAPIAGFNTTGDLDNDGLLELVIPALGLPPASPPVNGRVHVIREIPATDGSLAGLAWLTFEGSDPTEQFGSSAAAGDFNGDGCTDLAIGATGSIFAATNGPGRVHVFFGPFEPGAESVAQAEVVLEGSVDWDMFGEPMVVGDFDGDDIDDLAVSAIWDEAGGWEAGSVYVIPGARGGDEAR